jgi:hypothetical protein
MVLWRLELFCSKSAFVGAMEKPETVRTTVFLVEPLRLCVAGGQKGRGWCFRRPFFRSFFGRTKKEHRNERKKKRSEPSKAGHSFYHKFQFASSAKPKNNRVCFSPFALCNFPLQKTGPVHTLPAGRQAFPVCRRTP